MGEPPRGWGSAVAAFERAVVVARPVGRAAERLAIAALAGGGLMWWAVARRGASAAALAVVAVLALLPPAALVLFAAGIRALVGLPGRLREAPTAVRERAEVVRRRAGDLAASGRGPVQRMAAALRLSWALASSREILEVVGPATVLLSPWALTLAAVGAIAAVGEIVGGLVALATLV